jgi:2-keto-4-pentenoate hydratase/2-oxohepta-3-ene-1,7-dioic acid hydratase in catechol pathway|tara:strand:+ start:586 stop:1632 length:1047 start_codon:yes stop_codon:yes gene_type:complete
MLAALQQTQNTIGTNYMGVSIIKFKLTPDGETSWGVVKAGSVHKLTLDAIHHRELMDYYYNQRSTFDAAISPEIISLDNINYLAPLSQDIQLICQGLNYNSHRAESGASIDADDEENLMFIKSSSSICAPNETILRPPGCELLDYEIELGLVLKNNLPASTRVTDENLGNFIGGLILCNDVSARDMMFGAPLLQWFKGKSQRTFCPAGPVLYLLDPEDTAKLYELELTLKMNGKIKQQATTDQLIHKPPKTLTELASFTDMRAGDCILTGTPGGVLAEGNLKSGLAVMLNLRNDKKRRQKFVAAQQAQAKFLEPGDVLELEIVSSDGDINLGKQRNEIAEAKVGNGLL